MAPALGPAHAPWWRRASPALLTALASAALRSRVDAQAHPATRTCLALRYPLPKVSVTHDNRTSSRFARRHEDRVRRQSQRYLRAMDQLEAQPIRGTHEDPSEPVFSPDGQRDAYFAPAAIGSASSEFRSEKLPSPEAHPSRLGRTASPPNGASWRNGLIVFGSTP